MQNCFTNHVGMRVLPVIIRRSNFPSAKDSESGRGKNSGQKERMAQAQEHKCKTDDERLRPGNRLHEVRREWQSGNTDPFIVRPSVRPRGLSRDYFCRFAGTMSDF